MLTDEYFTTVLPRFSSTNVGTVVHVGTGGLDMSSSFSIDVGSYIPDVVREIFEHPKAEDWFVVYYLTRDKKVIAKHTFLFKGRDQRYQAKCVSDADGLFREVFIVYRGQTARYTPSKEYSLQTVEMGQHFYMTIQGEIIP
jgi:uncharacterized protein (UPF0248 family)